MTFQSVIWQAAAAQLDAAKRAASSARVDAALPHRISESAAAVAAGLAAAKRENDTVYLQRIPPAEQVSRCVLWSSTCSAACALADAGTGGVMLLP